jgi:Domain of unknown function (DUF4290)
MDYNTQREHLYFTEYGRGIQEMVKELLLEEDKDKRQRKAESIVEIMAILNSHMKGVEDYKQKFWDHIYAMTNYEIDLESPYGIPERAVKQARPEPLAYPGSKIKWNHLGKNIQELFEKGMKEEDDEKRRGFAQAIGNYMKVLYKNYHDETVSDESIKEELTHLSAGRLVYEANEFRKYVDGTLTDSSTVVNIRNHKMNKNYFEQSNKNQNRHKGNFKPKFGSSSYGAGSNKNYKKR